MSFLLLGGIVLLLVLLKGGYRVKKTKSLASLGVCKNTQIHQKEIGKKEKKNNAGF